MINFFSEAQLLLAIGTIPILLFFFSRRTAPGGNAVWGGATGGLIIGAITGLILDVGFLKVLGWGFIIGTYLGTILELPDLIDQMFRRRN